jgi:ribosomal protein S18 acetylase RimI-like enzyme
MDIRPFHSDDLTTLLDLTIATFGPFYEDSYRPTVGETVFTNRHGSWRQDYNDHLAAMHDPGGGKHAAVAVVGPQIVGFVAWISQPEARHGEIDILAVAAGNRRHGVGHALAGHAIAAMKADGAEMVTIGTGGDDFHAPARALYESLGFTAFPNIIYTKAV